MTEESYELSTLCLQKQDPENATRIALIPPQRFTVGHVSLVNLIAKRHSRRHFTDAPLTLEERSLSVVFQIDRNGIVYSRSMAKRSSFLPWPLLAEWITPLASVRQESVARSVESICVTAITCRDPLAQSSGLIK